jgi:hypothetical protein
VVSVIANLWRTVILFSCYAILRKGVEAQRAGNNFNLEGGIFILLIRQISKQECWGLSPDTQESHEEAALLSGYDFLSALIELGVKDPPGLRG